MDCPTITVHPGKHYKALIDSGVAYQHIDNSIKTLIQPTTAQLNAADGSPMTALGMTTLHLRIADLNSPIILSFATDCQTQNIFLG